MSDSPLERLCVFTPARLELGRAGASPSTAERLRFAVDHARARDAVRRSLNEQVMRKSLAEVGIESRLVRSQAETFDDHLLKPDAGRRLRGGDTVALGAPVDIAFVVADGLSAGAIERYAARLLIAFGEVSRVFLVKHGRVAIGDEIGEVLGASLAIVLIGERPGLSACESLGIYVTYAPRVGRTDAERVCISNVRHQGISPEEAAIQLRQVVDDALSNGRTGV